MDPIIDDPLGDPIALDDQQPSAPAEQGPKVTLDDVRKAVSDLSPKQRKELDALAREQFGEQLASSGRRPVSRKERRADVARSRQKRRRQLRARIRTKRTGNLTTTAAGT